MTCFDCWTDELLRPVPACLAGCIPTVGGFATSPSRTVCVCVCFLRDVPVHAFLPLFFFVLLRRERKSFWHPYWRILPRTHSTPLTWPSRKVALIDGTGLHQSTCAKRAQLQALCTELQSAFQVCPFACL